MASYRVVHSEFFTDSKWSDIEESNLAVRLAVKLAYEVAWTLVDGAGVMPADPKILWREGFVWEPELYPLFGQVVEWLLTLRLIVPFEADQRKFWWLPNFLKNQLGLRDLRFIHPRPPVELVQQCLRDADAKAYEKDLRTGRISSRHRAKSREVARQDDESRDFAQKGAIEHRTWNIEHERSSSTISPSSPSGPVVDAGAHSEVPAEVRTAWEGMLGAGISPKGWTDFVKVVNGRWNRALALIPIIHQEYLEGKIESKYPPLSILRARLDSAFVPNGKPKSRYMDAHLLPPPSLFVEGGAPDAH